MDLGSYILLNLQLWHLLISLGVILIIINLILLGIILIIIIRICLMTGAVFLDFKKAFDSVDHTLLLDKLYNLGILDREHEWSVNYLNGRKQIVDYHGMLSATKSIDVGVPQGSILGPFLFVLHVNDLPNATRHCSVLMYADDTVLFCSGRDASAIENKLNNEMSLLEHGFEITDCF